MNQTLQPAFLTLVAGDLPRCAFTTAAAYPNDAFLALDRADRKRVAVAVAAGERNGFVDAAGLRFCLIAMDSPACVLASAVPIEERLHSRMKLLPSILNFSRGLLPNGANLHRLVETLMAADGSLFDYCAIFVSHLGKAFIPLHVEPEHLKASKLHGWPLEFVIARRRAKLIAQAGTGRQSLAIPFVVSSLERYVVLAVLRRHILTESDRSFLRTISCVSDCVPGSRTASLHETEPVFAMPRLDVAYIANGAVDERCASLFAAWDWQVTPFAYPSSVAAEAAGDLIVVDSRSLGQPVSVLRVLRAALPKALVVYLGAADAMAEALADEILQPHASALAAGRMFKQIARDLRESRLRESETKVSREIESWQSLRSVADITQRLAFLLNDTLADWACVHIVDDDGTPFAAESPRSEQPALPDLPDFFLSGYSLFKPHIDDEFYREISKNPLSQERLASLGAVSGAAVPITADGALIGCAITLSFREAYDSQHFERISRAAASAGAVYAAAKTADRRENRSSALPAVCSDFQADAYSGPDCKGEAWVSVSGATIAIELTGPDNIRLSGQIDTRTGLLVYGGTAIAEPLVVNRFGPLPVLPVHGRERRIELAGGSIVLLFPNALTRGVRERGVARTLQEAARDRKWSVKHVLAEALGADALFASVSASV